MKRNIFKTYFLLITLGLFTVSCVDLTVVNENEPDAARALANPDDVKSLAGGSLRTIINQMQAEDGVMPMIHVMADHSTCSWGNFGMRDMSWEPRQNAFNNSLTYSYFNTIQFNWQNSYSAISSANTVLTAMRVEGLDFEEDNAMVEAFCLFASGLAHTWLGVIYDQANVILYDTDLTTLELLPWEEVAAAGLDLIDQAIAIADANVFTLPANWVGGAGVAGVMDNVYFSQLMNSYAARLMMGQSRTKAHNDGLDWTKIKAYADAGLTSDFTVEVGDAYGWYALGWVYLRYPGWGRVDHRIINQMDNSYPSAWPSDNSFDPGEADTLQDRRLASDFGYLSSNNFRPDRGYYHFSHYRHARYDYLGEQAWYGIGLKPYFMAWENELIKAECLARSGDEAGAQAILNDPAGPRKVRGMVTTDITDTGADLLRRITDEKDIECYLTGAGVPYMEMRRNDRLQPQTLLHFPVPATELEINQLEIYTINAVADGEQGSAGGWTGWDSK